MLAAAEKLSPELYKLPGVMTVGVLMSDNPCKLIVRIKHVWKNPEVLEKIKETLKQTGLPYVIQDVSKIDAKKRI